MNITEFKPGDTLINEKISNDVFVLIKVDSSFIDLHYLANPACTLSLSYGNYNNGWSKMVKVHIPAFNKGGYILHDNDQTIQQELKDELIEDLEREVKKAFDNEDYRFLSKLKRIFDKACKN